MAGQCPKLVPFSAGHFTTISPINRGRGGGQMKFAHNQDWLPSLWAGLWVWNPIAAHWRGRPTHQTKAYNNCDRLGSTVTTPLFVCFRNHAAGPSPSPCTFTRVKQRGKYDLLFSPDIVLCVQYTRAFAASWFLFGVFLCDSCDGFEQVLFGTSFLFHFWKLASKTLYQRLIFIITASLAWDVFDDLFQQSILKNRVFICIIW